MAEYVQLPPSGSSGITSIAAGSGLNGGTITTSGTVSVASVSLTNQVNGSLNYSNVITNKTIIATGTIGSATINALSGVVNFNTGMGSLVVTNNTVGTGSIILALLRKVDATAVLGSAVPLSGSFTLSMTTAPAAETPVGFLVINGP